MKGWVKAWFDQKGYGFIVPDDGSEDVFAHVNQVESHLDSLAPNALVSFELVIAADGRRQAQDIILLDASSTEARPAVQHTPRPEAPASPPARREPLFTP